MKKKSLAIGYFIILLQMLILCAPYVTDISKMENWPLIISVTIFIIGLIGGLLIRKISYAEIKSNDITSWAVVILGSVITTIGAFAIIASAFLIIGYSTFAALLLFMAFLLPATLYKHN